ncbi:MAG TPA: hypothetical protein VFA20_31860 [Myxococcaceae bacterium]|nr:hypothetical protein [Myxococcaceae bacterium]
MTPDTLPSPSARRTKSALFFPLTLLLAAGCASTTSSGPGHAPAPVPSTAFFSMSAASMDRFEAWAEEMELPVPELVQRGYIETNFPIIGEGGLRRSGPLTIYFSPRMRGSDKPTVTLVFPLTAGASPVERLIQAGARPVPDRPGMAVRRNIAFREAEGFLVVGPDPQVVASLDLRSLAQRLGRAGTLAEVDVDLARWRTTDPGTFHEIIRNKSSSHFPFLDTTGDHLRLTLADGGTSVRLSVEMEPIPLGESPSFPKPGFPANRIGRVDFSYPTADASRWMLSVLPAVLDEMEKDKKREASQAVSHSSALRAVVEDAVDTIWTADAVSMALERSGSQVVYHQVNQYKQPAGFTARLRTLLDEANRNLDNEKLTMSSYGSGATTITRVSSSLDPWTIDFVDTGTTVRFLIANDAKRRLPDVLALPAEGTISTLCTGTLDPGAALFAFADQLPPSVARAMATPLSREGSISWSSHSSGKATVVEVSVTKSLARFLGRLGMEVVSKEGKASKGPKESKESDTGE